MTSVLALILWLAGIQPQGGLASPGRASISGIVLPAEGIDPLAGVAIVLNPTEPPPLLPRGAPSAAASLFRARSDALGAFSLPVVPPGTYTITAEREGYSRQDRYQIGRGGPSQFVLNVVAGQRLTDLVVMMNPDHPISGTVYGAYGERLAAASVHAYRVKYTPAGRKLVHAMTVLSHESGEYRLFHLTPGYYVVSGNYSEQSVKSWESILHLTPNLTDPGDGLSTAYYAASMNLRDGKLVNLNNVREAANVDIAFKETSYFKLAIKLIPPPGVSFPNTKVALLPPGADLSTAADHRIRGSGTSFSIDHLAQGDYVLVALADFPDPDGGNHTSIISEVHPVRITEDASLAIAVEQPLDLPGFITLDSGGVSRPLPAGMKIRLDRVDNSVSQSIVAETEASGGFNLLDVGPGAYDVFVEGMPRNAYLQNAGFSISDQELGRIRIDASLPRAFDGINFRWRSSLNLSVSVDMAGGSAAGTVTGSGKDYPGAEVVLVPVEATARLRADRYFTTNSEVLGAFQLVGIPPGFYTAYAFQKIEPGIYFDPEFNSQILPRGTPVTIDAKTKASLNLTVITAEDLAGLVR